MLSWVLGNGGGGGVAMIIELLFIQHIGKNLKVEESVGGTRALIKRSTLDFQKTTFCYTFECGSESQLLQRMQ